MATAMERSMDQPDETRMMQNGKVDVVNMDGHTAMRATFQPGWRWSECVKPMANTDSCQVNHMGYMVSGHMRIRMDDGTESDINPGDVAVIPAGHDAWVVGEEQVVFIDFPDSSRYAVQGS